ncbi:MAG: histidine kinase, partial [Cytophagales bacterium]
LKDNRNGIWISTIRSGLFYLPSLGTTYLDSSNSTLKNGVNSTLVIGDSVLLGDRKGNLYCMDTNLTPWIVDQNIFENQKPIHGITKYKDKLFVNSENELALYDKGIKHLDVSKTGSSKINKVISENINDVFVIGQNIWSIGNDNKLTPIIPEKKGLGYFNYLAKYKGIFWLGSDYGLYQFDSANAVLKFLPKIVHSSVSCLLMIKSRYLLIGTHRNGLYSLDIMKSKCEKIDFDANDDFINVRDMILDSDQNAWIASRSSILRLKLKSNKENIYDYHSFSKKDGILNNSVKSLNFFDKNLLISTDVGLILLDTSKIFNNSSDLKIEISEIFINGARRILDSVYSLRYDQNNIQLLLEAVDLRYADLVKFEYKLNLLEEKWNLLKGKELAFLELSNGQSYTIFLRGINLFKNETSEIKTIVFHIAPPFWKKWWFVSMEALLTLSIVTGVFIKRGKLEKTRASREIEISSKMRELEMKALRSQMNPHFLFNALNSIYSMINSGDQSKAGQFLIRFSKLLRIVINQSMSVKVTLTEELKLLQIYIELEQMRFNDSFVFEMFVDDTLEPDLLLVPSFIIQPFVENAIIHGLKRKKGDDKKLQLLIRDAGDKIECKVIDNGVGRAQAALNKSAVGDTNKSVAMSNTSRRLEMVNMGKEDPIVAVELIDLLDEARNPKGTEVILRIIKEEIEESELQRLSLERTA